MFVRLRRQDTRARVSMSVRALKSEVSCGVDEKSVGRALSAPPSKAPCIKTPVNPGRFVRIVEITIVKSHAQIIPNAATYISAIRVM